MFSRIIRNRAFQLLGLALLVGSLYAGLAVTSAHKDHASAAPPLAATSAKSKNGLPRVFRTVG